MQSGPSMRDTRESPQLNIKEKSLDYPHQTTPPDHPPSAEVGGSHQSVHQVVTRSQSMRNILFENVEEPRAEAGHHLFKYLQPLSQNPGPAPAPCPPGQENRREESFTGFYEHFLKNTFLLDHHGFVQAQRADPFYANIIKKCLEEKECEMGNKIYFLHDEILFTKHKIEGLSLYRIVLPLSLAYDILTLTHRQRGHIREGKLLHLARLYYDFQSGEKLAKRIL